MTSCWASLTANLSDLTEPAITQYRIYMLNPQGGIVSGEDANCSSDEEACELALTKMFGIRRAEVWIGSRCVSEISKPS